MEFCLHYFGKLKSKGDASEKHEIRISLHNQIKSICNSDPFSIVFEPDIKGTRDSASKPMFVEHGNKRYWYLISEYLSTVVDLKITILVPHGIGKLVNNGGDIDNRVKTLFDALRIPSVSTEIPKIDNFDYTDVGMYCLLQDDKLINRVSIQTYRDHDSLDKDSVRCLIEVKTKITATLYGNLQFV